MKKEKKITVIEPGNALSAFVDYIKNHHSQVDGDGRWEGLTSVEKNELALTEMRKFQKLLTETFEVDIPEK